MNGTFRKAHPESKGTANAVFTDLIVPLVRRAASIVGISLLYIFSLPEERVIANYERYGLRRLGRTSEAQLHARLKPSYDDQCVFMYAVL